jgi:hypothetical protein
VHQAKVGEATGGERADQVQRRRRRVVRLQQPARVRRAGLERELVPVDDVPAVRGQGDAVARLVIRAARLRVLTRHPAQLDHRQARTVGENDRHLQDGLDLVADLVSGGVDERLRAVTTLQHECLATAGGGEPLAQHVRLPREHQRRYDRELVPHRRQGRRIRPRRLLDLGQGPPVVEALDHTRLRLDAHPCAGTRG